MKSFKNNSTLFRIYLNLALILDLSQRKKRDGRFHDGRSKRIILDTI